MERDWEDVDGCNMGPDRRKGFRTADHAREGCVIMPFQDAGVECKVVVIYAGNDAQMTALWE